MAYISLTPKIFLCTPYTQEWTDLKQNLKKIIATAGGVSTEDYGEVFDSVYRNIYNEIQSSDLVIADISLNNPNVLIEVGIALGMRKKVFLIARKKQPPFPLLNLPIYLYDEKNLTQLYTLIAKIVKEAIPTLLEAAHHGKK